MSRWTILCALFALFVSAGFAQEVTVTDETIQEGQTFTMTADTTYLLDGFVFVEEGAVLNIEAGTVIRGIENPSTGDNASALIIARGGKIYARGTAANPIIMTAQDDDLNDPDDLVLEEDRGKWGGLILLGNASTNQIENNIEGIPTEEARGAFGGTNDSDDSGVVRYVSVRYGGAQLSPGNEINGITFGGVGDQTIAEYLEVFANDDDGYEWFGGTVNTRNLVAAFCADDAFDFDDGWRGSNQFWLAVTGTDRLGRIAEQDGGTTDETAMPFAMPTIANATYIGPGADAAPPEGDGSSVLIFRDNAGGSYYNSIFGEYNGNGGGAGVIVEDLDGSTDSRERLEAGELNLVNNLWWNFADGNTIEGVAPQDFMQTYLADNGNQIVDPMYASLSRVADGNLDPRPSAAGPAASGAISLNDAFFVDTNYYGAFAPGQPLWTNNWTALSQNGYTRQQTTITDGSINAGETLTLTAGNEYLIDGFVFVEEGATLNIEPGVVIRGKEETTTGDNASALIIARGGKIYAEGTASQPIIFTAERDDLSDPNDMVLAEDRGSWGGLILLGSASTNQIENNIEGIPTEEARGAFGGDNDEDSSGVIRYISVRYGGAGLSPGNEINGVTFGGVGRGTVVENVEVFGNDDDGFEWFGGTVGSRNLVAAFCADDAFDYDDGWRGDNQFWFAIQSTDLAGRIAEHDGGTTDETAAPFAAPNVSNVTYIGAGADANPQGDGSSAFLFRDNAGGRYSNSIITEYAGGNGNGIVVEDLDGSTDSRDRLEAGELAMTNSLWWNMAAGNTLEGVAPQDFMQSYLVENGNRIVNPGLNSISRSRDGGLDPRPSAGSYGSNNVDGTTSYYGAFAPGQNLWTDGWTALYQEGYTSSRYLGHITRNGGGFQTTLTFNNAGSGDAQITLNPYDISGAALGTVNINIGGNGTRAYTKSQLFGDVDVSHIAVSAPHTVNVTASYAREGAGNPSAELAASPVVGQHYQIYQGDWSVVFDGLAITNIGEAEATVTYVHRDLGGNERGRVTRTVPVNAKDLVVFSDLGFIVAPGSVIEVMSDRPTTAVFLRGSLAGADPAYLYVNNPIVLD